VGIVLEGALPAASNPGFARELLTRSLSKPFVMGNVVAVAHDKDGACCPAPDWNHATSCCVARDEGLGTDRRMNVSCASTRCADTRHAPVLVRICMHAGIQSIH